MCSGFFIKKLFIFFRVLIKKSNTVWPADDELLDRENFSMKKRRNARTESAEINF